MNTHYAIWMAALTSISGAACSRSDAPEAATASDARSDAGATQDAPRGASDAGAGGESSDAAGERTQIDSADVGPTVATSMGIGATPGWQIYAGGSYRYGPSILIDADQSIHMWTCSPGEQGAWDFIRYRHSTDHGHTWTPDVIALQPTPGSNDRYSACDPGAVHVGPYFYLAYTSTTNVNGTQNSVFIARGTSPDGPFEKWNGASWGGDPQPIRTYLGNPTQYGYGEPSMVLLGPRLYLYYSDDEAAQFTNVAIADDATQDDWPAHLQDQGHAIARPWSGQDSADVKYVDAFAKFVAVTTIDRFTANASVEAFESADGLHFSPSPYFGARAQNGAHNIGLSGTLNGHFDVNAQNFVAYAYQPVGNGWGNWPTFVDPITIESKPIGTPVAGEVSSIVGGNDWSWSGPKAWDGDPTSVYSSAAHGAGCDAEEWAYVDTGALRSLGGVVLVPRPGGLAFPVDFSIQTSPDASSWTTVPGQSHVGFANPGGARVTFTFGQPVSARYIRVDATRLGVDDAATCYFQLAEITPVIAP